ncbi:thiamine diphosphokinase [Tissierella sp. Yu-01]|uniref:thiamine diphosphokinase n=1 Tax=Tissierella sp. Yu-01 TaxID=3035694 RepID=UPI00240D1E69|nr:thiamine diphosphokinase [Tissierella sp. Yu-01]WFA09806.1 thiamine diphosphokinase [Tissierella sp. Yu-01]
MKGLIISSGNIEDYKQLLDIVKDRDYILCADGGLRHAINIDIIPDGAIGDFDSIDEKIQEYLFNKNIPVYKFPIEKDDTDTELAIRHLLEIGCNDITLVGVTGTRLDHTLANIFVLRNLHKKGITARIINSNNTIYYVDNEISFNKRDGYYISVIPISIEGVIVTLKGFYYPLKDSIISYGSTLGVSNKIIEEYGKVIIEKGEALIIEARD